MSDRHTLIFHTIRLAKRIQEVMGFKPFPYSLNYSQASTILYIAANAQINQTKLALHLHLKSASIVTLVDQLEKLDLVRRENIDGDRRKYLITLTQRGKATVAKIKNQSYALDDFLRSKLGQKEAQTFHSTLEKLTAYLDDWKGGENEIPSTKRHLET